MSIPTPWSLCCPPAEQQEEVWVQGVRRALHRRGGGGGGGPGGRAGAPAAGEVGCSWPAGLLLRLRLLLPEEERHPLAAQVQPQSPGTPRPPTTGPCTATASMRVCTTTREYYYYWT